MKRLENVEQQLQVSILLFLLQILSFLESPVSGALENIGHQICVSFYSLRLELESVFSYINARVSW